MKLKTMFAAAAVVCVSASTATATGSDVYITGSSAFRGVIMAYLRSKLTNTRAVFDKTVDADLTKSVDASTFIVMSGNFNGSGSVTTFYLSFTGSVAGIRDLSVPQALLFPTKPGDFTTDTKYLLSNGGFKGTTKDTSGNITSSSFSAIADIGFSDAFQESTTYTGNGLDDHTVAVLPFVWITASGGSAAGITNMTPQIAQTLYKNGIISLANFSGVSTDGSKMVHAVGRTDDSGTRITAVAETGVGVFAGLHQFTPIISGGAVTGYTDVGNGGYISGSDLSTAMKGTTSSTLTSVAYVSVGDAESTTGASALSHNGVTYLTTLSTTSSAADAADVPLVTEGKYTFWGYEHMFPRADEALSGDAATVHTNLLSNLETGFSSTRKVIRKDAMNCERGTDGDIVLHN